MEIGEIKVIDERFVTGSMIASWDEYLVLERLEDGFKLDIRVYDLLEEITEFDEGEDGALIYPEEIDGKKVMRVDDGVAYGGDLVQMTDDTPEIIFKTFNQKILDGWLKEISWGNSEVIKKLNLLLA